MAPTKFDISTTTAGTQLTSVTVPSEVTDGADGNDEVTWTNEDWNSQWGYFNNVPELKSALLMKGAWDVGKGFTADDRTTVILDHISGWGKDNFTDILFNMDIISRLSGDAYAEIIRDKKTGVLLNVKPLSPDSIRIVCDGKGTIKRYEQINRITNSVKKFEPSEIFHLSHNRLADQIHGISDLQSMEKTLLAENENFEDMKQVAHRMAKPVIAFKLGTDNQAKINAFITKMDDVTSKGKNIYIPDDENTVSYEVIQVNVSDIIMAWRADIRNKFYRTLGLPQIVFGSAGTTESGGKMEYLAHEQVFEHDQRFLEQQIFSQLGLKINLISPVSLLPALQMDQNKDGENKQMTVQPNDITGGIGR